MKTITKFSITSLNGLPCTAVLYNKEHNPIIKAIIDAKKSVIMSDMGLLAAQYDIQSDIAKIISRLDALEEKISHIQDRKPP